MRSSPCVALALTACAVALGCGRGARTPEEAYDRLAQAARARDGEWLYQALDLETRWSWMTVRRSHREAYDIVLSNFPEGAQREQHLRRFEPAALCETDAALFAAQVDAGRWAELGRALADGERLAPAAGDERRAGRLVFRRGQNGRWGFAGFSEEAEQQKRRALADLELIRTNATDYERALARGGR